MNTNQFVVSVLFITLVVAVHSEDENWSVEEDNCVNELKLDKSAIQAVKNETITPDHNSDFNNFLSCYWKRKGAQEQNGEINWDKADELLEEELRKESANWSDVSILLVAVARNKANKECQKDYSPGATHGETVAKFLNCVTNKVYHFLHD